jgi:hypothetical protein
MATLFANENGDWWAADEDGETAIYVLDTDNLTETETKEIEAEYGESIEAMVENSDKLEKLIHRYGKVVWLPVEL